MSGRSTDAIQVGRAPEGTWFKVRAVPGSSRNRVTGILGDALKVCVSAAPEKGKANQRLLTVLANCLGLSRGDLQVVGGETSRDKRVLVLGLSTTELRNRLAKALQSDL